MSTTAELACADFANNLSSKATVIGLLSPTWTTEERCFRCEYLQDKGSSPLHFSSVQETSSECSWTIFLLS